MIIDGHIQDENGNEFEVSLTIGYQPFRKGSYYVADDEEEWWIDQIKIKENKEWRQLNSDESISLANEDNFEQMVIDHLNQEQTEAREPPETDNDY